MKKRLFFIGALTLILVATLVFSILMYNKYENVPKLVEEYEEINMGRTGDIIELFLIVGIIIVLLLICASVVLIKKKDKLLGIVFLTSGIIGLLAYIFIYYMGTISLL